MKVSVVMATYNGAKYIREQLNSIFNQSTKIDELIISDDGSTDNTMQIINEYLEKYPKLIRIYQNETTQGYARNFWSAIRKATNEIIILSDQDDVWDNDKVSVIVNMFCSSEEILSLNLGYRIINSDGKEVHDMKFKHFKDNGKLKRISFHEFARAPKYPGMSMAFRKKIYDKICDYDDELIIAHDWLINQAAAKEDGMFFLDKTVSSYRQHGLNTFGISATFSKDKMFERRINVINEVRLYHKKLLAIYGEGDSFLNKLNKTGKKRQELFQSKKLIGILFHYIVHMKYISFRDLCGDVYVILKS